MGVVWFESHPRQFPLTALVELCVAKCVVLPFLASSMIKVKYEQSWLTK